MIKHPEKVSNLFSITISKSQLHWPGTINSTLQPVNNHILATNTQTTQYRTKHQTIKLVIQVVPPTRQITWTASTSNQTIDTKFSTEADKRKIMASGTWNIDGNHLILKHWSQGSLTNDFISLPNSFKSRYTTFPMNIFLQKTESSSAPK